MIIGKFNLQSQTRLLDQAQKIQLNKDLFTEVAAKYDLVTRLLSFGRDHSWKVYLVRTLPSVQNPKCLDLACGTGDISRLIAKKYPEGSCVGLDLTEEMLKFAQEKSSPCNLDYVQGNMQSLAYPDETFDLITGGYALRNSPNLDLSLKEIKRVLKVGGVAGFLDFSKSSNKYYQKICLFVLRLWGTFWGVILHGDGDIYGYLADSLEKYPTRDELHKKFSDNGFILLREKLVFGGMLAISVLRRK
jgi:demethylmenaquinone methyltransferase/2-methoxy-6-polyprenyl-1,4-benzoquinol methylase